MPTLYVYLAEEEMNFLHVKNTRSFTFYNLPFSYSHSLYTTILGEREFYDLVLDHVVKTFKTTLKGLELVVTSAVHPPEMNQNLTKYIELSSLLADFSSYLTFLVSRNYLQVGSEYTYSVPLSSVTSLKEKDENLLSNLDIYTQTLHLNRELSDLIDVNIYSNAKMIHTGDHNHRNIMFTGSRFTEQYNDLISKYTLSFDLVKEKGVSLLKMDQHNFFPLLELLAKTDYAMYEKIVPEIEYPVLGSLLNVPGAEECLVTKEDGAKHLIPVADNKVVVLPLGVGERARVMVKFFDAPSIEYVADGGKVGLVVDPRDKTGTFFGTPDYKKTNFELRTQIQEILERF